MEYGNVRAAYGYALAFDLDHDPRNGCDAHALVRELVKRRDPRVVQAISNGMIWSRKRASEGWRRYTGSNTHTQHAHVSIDPHRCFDTSPWFEFAGSSHNPPPRPKPPTKPAAPARPQAGPKPPVKVSKPKPRVPTYDISNIVAQARKSTRVLWGVKAVQAALNARLGTKLAVDGRWGPATTSAYSRYQRQLGYTGADANGVPGRVSLTKLGAGRFHLAA